MDKKVEALGWYAMQVCFLTLGIQGTRKRTPQGKYTQQNNGGGPANPIDI